MVLGGTLGRGNTGQVGMGSGPVQRTDLDPARATYLQAGQVVAKLQAHTGGLAGSWLPSANLLQSYVSP